MAHFTIPPARVRMVSAMTIVPVLRAEFALQPRSGLEQPAHRIEPRCFFSSISPQPAARCRVLALPRVVSLDGSSVQTDRSPARSLCGAPARSALAVIRLLRLGVRLARSFGEVGARVVCL